MSNIPTKEEIKDFVAKQKGYSSWGDYYDWVARDGQYPSVVAQLIESAMQEYADLKAKQVAIGFGDWLQFNYQPHAEAGKWYDHHKLGNEGIEDIFTAEQLFDQYLIYLQNQKQQH